MKEENIIAIAVENLLKNYAINATWNSTANRNLDGLISILLNKKQMNFNIEVKKELRAHQLPQIIEQAKQFKPLIIIANRIFPKIKDELRKLGIAHLETNGNIYINTPNNFLWLDGQKPLTNITEKTNRAFSKTGLKVVFELLMNKNLINLPYREIANFAEAGLGNINNILKGLEDLHFLIRKNKSEKFLDNKDKLIDKWAINYIEKLKPSIFLGSFNFVNEKDFMKWQKLNLKNSCWGGEPAADLLTNYLSPQELTIYTEESRSELIKNYRLVPEKNGNIKVYAKFWKTKLHKKNIAPELIAYADLLGKDDRRCAETAKKIYDEYIQNKI